MRVLLEYLKDSKRSDRELAKVVGVSQPTVTRMRQRLVKEGAIREFTVIPDFVKMGYEIMAISHIKTKVLEVTELEEKAEKYWKKYANVIFVSRAEGVGKNGVLISLHKSYADYSVFSHALTFRCKDDCWSCHCYFCCSFFCLLRSF